jgi:hypothetical protein
MTRNAISRRKVPRHNLIAPAMTITGMEAAAETHTHRANPEYRTHKNNTATATAETAPRAILLFNVVLERELSRRRATGGTQQMAATGWIDG